MDKSSIKGTCLGLWVRYLEGTEHLTMQWYLLDGNSTQPSFQAMNKKPSLRRGHQSFPAILFTILPSGKLTLLTIINHHFPMVFLWFSHFPWLRHHAMAFSNSNHGMSAMSLSGMQLMALKPPGRVKNPGRGPDLGITYRKCSLKNRYLVANYPRIVSGL